MKREPRPTLEAIAGQLEQAGIGYEPSLAALGGPGYQLAPGMTAQAVLATYEYRYGRQPVYFATLAPDLVILEHLT